MTNSELFNRILNEATYKWDLDVNDRSWVITPTGELWADVSHRLMFKHKFPDEWQRLKQAGESDGDAEDTIANRLIGMSYIKIGELHTFYSLSKNLSNQTKDALQGFCSSWLKKKPEDKNKFFNIQIRGKESTYTVEEIANDKLMTD